MYSPRASAIEVSCRGNFDQFEQSAITVGVHVVTRTQQAGIKRRRSRANVADALYSFAVNLVRCFARVFGIMRPVCNGFSVTDPKFLSSNNGIALFRAPSLPHMTFLSARTVS